MKFSKVVSFALLCVAPAAAFAPASSLPDLAKQYYERQNCHSAYDLVVEDFKAGRSVSPEARAWGKSYEEAGDAGRPCPEPSSDLAGRAANRILSTPEGLGKANVYRKLGDPVASLELGLAVLHGKVPEVAAPDGLALVKLAADKAEPAATFLLASLHIAGSFGKPDYVTAAPLVESAAQAGHVDALFMAGNLYKEGIGVKADQKKSFEYYRQAAERGHTYAAIMAFDMLQSGKGTKKDFNLSYRLGRNLADRGEVYGAVMAASALLQQKDALKHEDEVLYWVDFAIRNGDANIKSQIGALRPAVVAAYSRAKAPPEYRPRVRKLCPLKKTCFVNHFSGLQSCTTNVDYWNDCDG